MIDYIQKDIIPKDRDLGRFVRMDNQKFMIIENILFHTSPKMWEKYKKFELQVVIPENMIKPVLELFHDHPTGGHFNLNSMLSKMMPKVWWKNMPRDVQNYCDSCHNCMISRKYQENKNHQ